MNLKKNNEFKIGSIPVGEDHPVFTIAEVGLAHDGSLGAAHAYIDAAAEIGATAIKFQTHMADAESSKYEQFRVRVFPQDESRTDYWNRTAFDLKQWQELAQHSRDKNLIFLSSPFSEEAVELLEKCDVAAWKVASGEVDNLPLLKKMAETGKPLLISSGMSAWAELDKTVQYLNSLDCSFGIFQCTTSYPCPPTGWGLNIIDQMRKRYACPVGLSDHSGTVTPSIAATVLGASMLEFHVAFSHLQFGPDTLASLTFEAAAMLMKSLRELEIAKKNPIDKDEAAASRVDVKKLFSKSLYASENLEVGTILSASNVRILKPHIGIPASDYESVLGSRVTKEIQSGEPIEFDAIALAPGSEKEGI